MAAVAGMSGSPKSAHFFSSAMCSLSWITTKRTGCWFLLLPAMRPAWSTRRSGSSAIGSFVYDRVSRFVTIAL